jgi:nitrate/nitrite transporter NarK
MVILFGALFLMSQFFQTAQGRTPLQAGAELLVWSATGLFVAPIAGRLADRYGNRPFMLIGLLMQTVGLGSLAIIARQNTPFLEIAPLLLFAGTGTAMVFPTVTNAVMASVSPLETGIASGTNSALRELGGVFGVAALASVFNRPGVYSSAHTFVAGFRSALWVAVAFSAVGILLTLYVKDEPRSDGHKPNAGDNRASQYRTRELTGVDA